MGLTVNIPGQIPVAVGKAVVLRQTLSLFVQPYQLRILDVEILSMAPKVELGILPLMDMKEQEENLRVLCSILQQHILEHVAQAEVAKERSPWNFQITQAIIKMNIPWAP